MSDTPRTDAIAHRGFHADVLIAKAIDLCRELERENAALRAEVNVTRKNYEDYKTDNIALREQLINVTSELTVTKANASADKERLEGENAALRAEVDQWASRCAAAIWMLPETVTGGELRAAQDKFHRERENLRRENAALREDKERLDSRTILLTENGERVHHVEVNLRAAIDAARKEAKP
jgi:FtsZ-binding cell division protein ZapB